MAAVSGLTLLLGTALGELAAGVVVDVPASEVTFSGVAPAVALSTVVVVPETSVAIAAAAPFVATGAAVAVPATEVTVVAQTPDVSLSTVVLAPVATITVSGLAPTVVASVTIAVPAATILVAPLAPTIPAAVFVSPPAVSITFVPLAPVVYADQVIQVPATTVTLYPVAPVISSTIIVSPPPAAVTLTALAPTVGLAPAVLPPPVVVTLTRPSPAVFTESDDYGVYEGSRQAIYSLPPLLDGVAPSGGVLTVYSRRFGYTYGHFDVYPSAAPNANAVIPAKTDPAVVLTEAQAAALAYKVSVTFGDVMHDLYNGTGSRLYKGTVLLSNDCTLQEAYQYLQWLTRSTSTTALNGVPGWAYRRLHPSYPDSPQAPFGVFLEDTFFVAQGWLLLGVSVQEATKYRLVSHDGVVQVPPQSVSVSVGNLVAGDQVLVGRAAGGTILRSEYTPVPAIAGVTSLSVEESISPNTPPVGVIRIRGRKYSYAGVSPATKTFGGLSPPLVVPVASTDDVFVPFVDRQAVAATESAVFSFVSPFEIHVIVRNGGPTPIVPFTATVLVTQTGASVNVSRVVDL